LRVSGQAHPVPVKDHVLSEDVACSLLQGSLAGCYRECLSGLVERHGPGRGEGQRAVGAEQRAGGARVVL
jgi:hypothetical protein